MSGETLEFEDEGEGIANAKLSAEAKRKREARKQFENNIIAKQMHTYDGRAFVWDVLSKCHINHENLCGEQLQMAKFEGERAIGLRLTLSVLTITPERYNLMREEAVQREKDWL